MLRLASTTGLLVAVLLVSFAVGQDKPTPTGAVSSPNAAPAPSTTPTAGTALAQPTAPAQAGNGTATSSATAALTAGADCPTPAGNADASQAPTLSAIAPGIWVGGTAPTSTKANAQIVICVGKDDKDKQKVADTVAPTTAASDGTFEIKLNTPLAKGQVVTALVNTAGTGGPATYSAVGKSVTVGDAPVAGTIACTGATKAGGTTTAASTGSPASGTSTTKTSQTAATAPAVPTLHVPDVGYWMDGSVTNPPADAQIIICVEGQQADTVKGFESLGKDGTFHVQLKNSLQIGQNVRAQLATPASEGKPATFSDLSTPVTVGANAASFDFGRVRIYLSAGAILSQDQGQFSKTSTYLDFNTDSTWLMKTFPAKPSKDALPAGFQINTLFDARLTALPVTSCQQQTGTTTTGPTSSTCTTESNASPSISTPKGALISAGLYFPIYFGWSSWRFDDDHRHALYLAPIAKGGFETLVQSAQSTAGTANGGTAPVTTTTVNGQTFFHFIQGGSRFGLYKFHDENPGVAPDQIMYLDITWGSYENFPSLNAQGAVIGHPWRLGLEGRFMVPKIPVFLGFNSNTRVGSGQGDLRFLFGTSFDVGCLLQKVGVSNPGVAACDSKKSSAASTPAPKQ